MFRGLTVQLAGGSPGKGKCRLSPAAISTSNRRADRPACLSKICAGSVLVSREVLAVPANTLIVADTMGFHARGISARLSTRVEIWAYSRRNPFIPWLGFDAAAFPPIKGRAVPLYWSAMDLRELLKLGRNPWGPVGLSTALAPPQPRD